MPFPNKDGFTDHMELDVLEKYKKAIQFIEDVTSNAEEVQKRVLSEILTQNGHVEYLQRHCLDGRTDQEIFKRLLPVVDYEDLKPDIQRIANGDTSPILCGKPISELLTSSGTSAGEAKLIPSTEEELERRSLRHELLMPVMTQFVQGLDKGKGQYFLFVRAESKTPGGLVARPVLTSFYKSKQFKDRHYDPNDIYTSPIEAILCSDSYQSMYSQLLCGLYQNKQVVRMGAAFATGLVKAIQFLEKNWTSLCNDIRTGTLDARITDHLVREAVVKIVKSDHELAELVESECSRDSWKGIITRLWPNTKYIEVTVTGSMSQYIPTLDFYSNGLPLASTKYGSSECFCGVNLDPLCKPSEVSYTLIPTVAYFEFLPIHINNGVVGCISTPESLNEKERSDMVDLVDVELGKEYELVVTTYTGLYRYRVGDVLRVAGFRNKAPQFNFVRRKNLVLSIDADKTNEVDLQNAMNNAIKLLEPFGALLIEYTSYADTSSIPGHYVLYWELRIGKITIPSSVFAECCLAVEESLNIVYREGRVFDKTIGPTEIKIVEMGTFDKLMDYALSRGASMIQYKTPLCVKSTPIIELLNSRVISNYFSPNGPKWFQGISNRETYNSSSLRLAVIMVKEKCLISLYWRC